MNLSSSGAAGRSTTLWNPRNIAAAVICVLVTAAAIVLAVRGANTTTEGKPAAAPTPAQVQAQIKSVEDNPNMPPGIKQMVLGRLKGELPKSAGPGGGK